MNICAVDTSTARLGIALALEGSYRESLLDEGLHHTEHLTAEMERLLRRSEAAAGDIDLFVCVRGPGSFTGLRIGMAAVKGLAFGNGKPLVSVPSLDLYAYGREYFPGTVLPVIDARKKRVYAALYRDGERVSDISDCTPQELHALLPNERVLVTGPYAPQMLSLEPFAAEGRLVLDRSALDSRLHSLVELGRRRLKREGPDEEARGPLYIRRSEAEEARCADSQ